MSRILVVDDDAYFCNLMGLYLRAQGHDVQLAANGREGIEAARRATPALVLADFQMPQMDGFALFNALRAAPDTRRVPVVMITSHRSRDMMVKALGLGFDGFLGKPFVARELQQLIDDLAPASQAIAPTESTRSLPPYAGRFAGSVVCCEICRLEAFARVLKKRELFAMLDKFTVAVELAVNTDGGWVVKPDPHHLLVAFHDETAAPAHAARALRGALKIVLAAQRLKPWIAREFPGRDLPEFVVGVGVHSGAVEARLPAPGSEGGVSGDAAAVARLLAESILSLGWSVAASRAVAQDAGIAFVAGRSAQLHLPSHGAVDAVEVRGFATPRERAWSAQTDTLVEAAVERNATLVTYAAAIPKQPAAAVAKPSGPAPRAATPKSAATPVTRPPRPPADPFAGRTPVLKLADNGVVAVHLMLSKGGAQEVVKTVLINDGKKKRAVLEEFVDRYAVLRALEHPNIARTTDHGVSAKHLFVAQEYCSGGDLRNVIAQGLAADDAIKVLLRIAGGLKAAHQKGFVHGDLKPSNVMIREDGSYALVDFALARVVEYAIGEGDAGVLLRSPDYLAPETINGSVAHERSDIYALGLLLHEMLTGKRAYASPDLSRVMMDQLGAPVPILPEAHARFQPLLERLMAKKVSERFASVPEVIAFMMDAKLQA